MRLQEFGPALWPALQQVVDEGVTLVSTGGGPVRVAGKPVSLAVDLRRDGGAHPDADLLIEPVVDLGPDVRVPAQALRLFGSPPHGAVLLPGDPGLPSDLVPESGLLLLPVQPVPRRAEKLLTAGPLRVPATDRARFLTGFYPALHRALPVRSSDGSLELPEVLPPQLCLRVEHAGGHRAHLTWSVLYRAGEEVRRLPLAGADGAAPDAGRDVAAEERLVRSLPLPADRCPGCGRTARSGGWRRPRCCPAWTPLSSRPRCCPGWRPPACWWR